MNQGEYYCTHYFWDDEDREYILCATWFFEKNYPTEPNLWHLTALEVEEQEPGSPDLDVTILGKYNVWLYVENEGPSFENLKEVDHVS
jgi:hypothetical protein